MCNSRCIFVTSEGNKADGKKPNIMTQLQDVYLTEEAFNKDLDECLTIISYPSKRKPYYVCEHISAALYKRKVNVYVNK